MVIDYDVQARNELAMVGGRTNEKKQQLTAHTLETQSDSEASHSREQLSRDRPHMRDRYLGWRWSGLRTLPVWLIRVYPPSTPPLCDRTSAPEDI